MSQGQNIQVFVRCRPPNSNERRSVVEVLPDRNEVRVLDRSKAPDGTKNFIFDQVFSSDSRQCDVYVSVVKPLIDQVLQGFNCTVFAYGQTGTGKTYTMEGHRSEAELSWEDDPHSGIIPRAISQLFDTLKEQNNEFSVRVSFLELHNEDTYDLLSSIGDTTKLKIFDDAQKKGSVVVGGLEEIIVQTKSEIYDILKRGSAKRQTAATLLNACSSRSHTVFSVTVHIKEGSIDEEELLKIGKLNLVDLAGSENIGRSGAQDKRAREAGNINQSLLTLGRVITALVEKRPHVPYRESKLTRLLQDSLGGRTKTSIIATISPGSLDLEDTLSTLDYASRAKRITNKPEANQKLTKKALLRELAQEIERLRRDLQATREKNGIYLDEENYKDMCKQLSASNSAINEKEERMDALMKELEKNRKLFEEFSTKYEQTRDELEKSQIHCQRQKELIREQKQHEKKLMKVAQAATNDIYLLHNKKDRIESILNENRENIDKYHPEVREAIANNENLIEMFMKELKCLSAAFYDRIKTGIVSSNEMVARVKEEERQALLSRSSDLKKSIPALEIQASGYRDQAILYESLFKDCETQSKKFMDQAQEYKSLASKCNDQSKNLRDEICTRTKLAEELNQKATKMDDSIAEFIKDTMLSFDHLALENSKKLEQISITLDSTMKRELGTLNAKLERFFTRVLKGDTKTGSTPQRRVFDLPKRNPNLDSSIMNNSIMEDEEEDGLNNSGFV